MPNTVPPGTSATRSSRTPRTTRVAVVWAAVVVGLLALILLIIFILQNQQPARVYFLGLDGTVPLGMALLVAAVGGGVLVAAAGLARIVQLRAGARKARRSSQAPPAA
ncbi:MULTISPECIES: LapA family protein [Arthrobacter]|uniref:LapA family protein n=2 Tax=Arthrobacter TaxID=1663 RepID=A0ABU9KJ97_9MICC|nr:LapA family protein [Arthrobacter sp. YJM1]MDP5226521.1 LapA family protein [Arthrobacter sp. YJM1]